MIMSLYMRNYWSLYLDFLNDFKDIKYKGISLAYLCHFRSLVRSIDPLIQHKNLTKQLKHQVKDKKQVQAVFNQFIQANTRKKLVKNPKGIVVFHDVYHLLRLNGLNPKAYCNPAKSMIISETTKVRIAKNRNKQTNQSPKVSVGQSITINVRKQQPKNQVVKNNVSKSKNGLRVDYFQNYSVDTKMVVSKVCQQARAIIYKYRKHPLYSNAAFQKALLKQLAGIINRIEEAEGFLSKVNVSCIVLASTHYYQSRTFAVVAAKRGIPSICLQHGIIGSETGYIPKIATVDAVYGQFEIDWYKKAGGNKNGLEIIGHPRFDRAFKKSTVTRAQFHKKLGLNPSKKTILIALRGSTQMNRWKKLIQAISKKLDVNIVVKDFPTKNSHELSRTYKFVRTTQNYSLYDIFPNVDLVIAYPSTVGLEAMLANKPVFILNYPFNGYTGYYNNLGELVQTDPQKLGQLIIKYLTNAAFKKYADNKRKEFIAYAYPNKELSGVRLKKLINKWTM